MNGELDTAQRALTRARALVRRLDKMRAEDDIPHAGPA